MSKISRRDFLKIMSSTGASILFPQFHKIAAQTDTSKPNIIILLFDAMTARNLSLHGYRRKTAPNLERFAERSIVYHNHTASGNFTIPATGSLLTGTYPWTHRAINQRGIIHQDLVEKNIFRAIGPSYHRMAFPQTVWSDLITSQFASDIETLLPTSTYSSAQSLYGEELTNDINMAIRSLDDFVLNEHESASLFMGPLLSAIYYRDKARVSKEEYPRGIPFSENYSISFKLEDLFDGLAKLIPNLQSTFAYFHLHPPHSPYRATSQFHDAFKDGYRPIKKPDHWLSDHQSNAQMISTRKAYDEFLLSTDWEIGKLFDVFEKEGVFENSYIIVTADHGEMFERGQIMHTTDLLYQPSTHIPLLISTPGQKTRRDVYAPTSTVDLLPTIVQLAGQPIPEWTEGDPLPELGGEENMQRSVYTVEAKKISSFGPLYRSTVSLRQGPYKLIYYTGYSNKDIFEFYDVGVDPEELEDLYPSQPSIVKLLKEELLDKLSDVNKPYLKS